MERCLCMCMTHLLVNLHYGEIMERYVILHASTLKASTLNLFNKVVHFDDANGFDGYIESVEMHNYYKSIPSGIIAARMTYLMVAL